VLREMGLLPSPFAGQPVNTEFPIPTVYTVDLRDPAGLFLAGRFAMRSEDVIFL
jgi:hypothetical protein